MTMIHTKLINRIMRWLALFCGAAIIPAVLHAQNDASETDEVYECPHL
jgi:hypothetical protein